MDNSHRVDNEDVYRQSILTLHACAKGKVIYLVIVELEERQRKCEVGVIVLPTLEMR